jgi:23S rRNA (adenine2503-C2)-methyltransferase
VTVSTVAPTPDAFGALGRAPCVLAWSVHAARDDLRRQLVPTTKYTMVELRQGLIDALLQRPRHLRTIMLEVALMDHVNDSLVEAKEMADFAQDILDAVPGSKLIVNLIPWNDIGGASGSGSVHPLGYRKPSPARVETFQRHLWSCGIFTHVRATRGEEESAACGQLATRKVKLVTTIASTVASS